MEMLFGSDPAYGRWDISLILPVRLASISF